MDDEVCESMCRRAAAGVGVIECGKGVAALCGLSRSELVCCGRGGCFFLFLFSLRFELKVDVDFYSVRIDERRLFGCAGLLSRVSRVRGPTSACSEGQ